MLSSGGGILGSGDRLRVWAAEARGIFPQDEQGEDELTISLTVLNLCDKLC